ncbi:MAG: HlyD family efflux transporter periplasmic adaptor subunit [Phycisphaerales bacterium]|nr:HlyD family efflux transporter periplasmic adaptor subunit [Phycisphaerales bacterium]
MSSEAAGPLLKAVSVSLRILIGVAVLAAGVGIAAALVASKKEPPEKPVVSQSLLVGTIPATALDVPRQWSGYGTARAMNAVDIAAQVSARVTERPTAIEAGAPIRAGDLILQLERTDYDARLRSAEQQVAQAAADLDALDVDEASWQEQLRLGEEQVEIESRELRQATEAMERNASTPSEIDRRSKALRALEAQVSGIRQQFQRVPSKRQSLQATLDRLKADADLARQNLERTTIASPITGVLQSVNARQGELLAVGSPVARVVDLSRVEVPLRLPASALGYVAIGDQATLRPDGPSSKHWTGKVVRIAPEADPATRTLAVFVEVAQKPSGFEQDEGSSLLLPGEFVVGELVGAPEHGRTLVPRRAIQDGAVFLAEPGDQGAWISRRVPVSVLFYATGSYPEIDPVERQWAVLEAPLPAGAPVIVTNLDDLTDGRFVEQKSRAAAEPAPEPKR